SSTAWLSRRADEQSPIETRAGTSPSSSCRSALLGSSCVRTTRRSASSSLGSPVTASASEILVPSIPCTVTSVRNRTPLPRSLARRLGLETEVDPQTLELPLEVDDEVEELAARRPSGGDAQLAAHRLRLLEEHHLVAGLRGYPGGLEPTWAAACDDDALRRPRA